MTLAKPRRSRRAAFTLLEVLLVLAILGVIAAIVVPNLLGSQQKANIKKTQIDLHSLESAVKLYAVDHEGTYPAGGQEEMLAALRHPKDEAGQTTSSYLEKDPKDAWGQVLFYTYDAADEKPRIWSSGPNKTNEDGGGDDINNWDEAAK